MIWIRIPRMMPSRAGSMRGDYGRASKLAGTGKERVMSNSALYSGYGVTSRDQTQTLFRQTVGVGAFTPAPFAARPVLHRRVSPGPGRVSGLARLARPHAQELPAHRPGAA